jgi:hypothetical protein
VNAGAALGAAPALFSDKPDMQRCFLLSCS